MKVEPIRDPETIERFEHVLRFYCYRDWFLFKIGINVGLRGGDLLALKVRQVRGKEYLSLKERKTKKFKRILLNDHLQAIIADYCKFMDDDDYLFRSIIKNEAPTTGHMYRRLHFYGSLIGLQHIGTHTMRKTFGYHFYRREKNIALLMEFYGHANESDTLRYIGVTQEELNEAIKNHTL